MRERIASSEWKRLQVERWTSEDARRVLADWKHSGESVSAFCRRQGLKEQRVSWWKKQLADWKDAPEPSQTFAAAVISDVASPAIAIRLPAGVIIEVADTAAVAPAWISKLVAGLSRRR